MRDFRSRCFRLLVVASAPKRYRMRLEGPACDSFHNDEKLLAAPSPSSWYVGSIVDQAISDPIWDELHEELVSDMSSALDARQTAVDWGVAKAVADTNPFAHTGYKLASRLLRMDQPLIESLARELTFQGTIEGDALRSGWTAMQARSILMNWKQVRRN